MKSTIKKDGTGQRRGWTAGEIEQVIILYLTMRTIQRNPEKFGKLKKAPLVREYAEDLGRSKGSIECKLMNISHCIQELKLGEIVQGYKPLRNVQKGMLFVVEHVIRNTEEYWLEDGAEQHVFDLAA